MEIVRDIDCVFYLLGGILDYENHPVEVTAVSNDSLEYTYIPASHNSETAVIPPPWAQGMDLPPYQKPENTDILYQNFAIFNQVRSYCKENLEVELERLLKEANTAADYLNRKNKIYDAAILVNLMMTPPSSYTMKSIKERHLDRLCMKSPYLGVLMENEKSRGQLLYYVKSATIPLADYPAIPIQNKDIQNAQKILQKFIQERLLGTLPQNEGKSENRSSTVYHKIDPLDHRTLFLLDRDKAELEGWSPQFTGITTMVMKRNLLGETGLHLAKKYGLKNLELEISGDIYHSANSYEITTDIRGCGAILAIVLVGRWDEYISDLERQAEVLTVRGFFSQAEVPGLEKIQKAFPGLHSNPWSYLDPYQLATLMGNLDFIRQVEASAPGFFSQTYNRHHTNEDNSVYGYLSGIFPELTLGEYHPVILSALAGYTDITRYHLKKNPELSKLQTNSWGGKLGALFLIAFKKGDLELLDLLNEVAPFELSSGERVVLSRQAAELATPIVFQTWVNLAWFDLGGFTWGADSVRCELWRAILESLYSRYEGTQGTEDQDIQNEKARFVEVIWGLEQSMYLARCGCPSCEEHYLKAHQVLSSFDGN
ncbi:hypothetical protein TWF192_002150 [Orbilia oligospora]|uniref:Uncharacterized protein n=1 Tax=Orbilia oligospora TaxID=2813651 RepID=A0A6G1LV20_ORBOL|nr:hypothetical protein TWF191_009924 [Orbilia oligospora]KAF3233441.1 hypothetical protein TWF192_002150 [Orbilia oligospora]